MTSKAARRRRKVASRPTTDAFEIAPIAKRARGRDRMAEIRRDEDASLPVMQSRCRRAGVEATPEAIRNARAPWSGCKAGLAIQMTAGSEANTARLWGAAQHVRGAYAARCRAEGIPLPHATCLRILLPVDAMHADAETAPMDMRTEAERIEAARKSWDQVEAWLGRYGRHTAQLTKRCVIDDLKCEDATAMCLALDVVAKGLEGSR